MQWRPGLERFMPVLLCVWLLVRDTEVVRPLSVSLCGLSSPLKAQVWKRPQLELAPQHFQPRPRSQAEGSRRGPARSL